MKATTKSRLNPTGINLEDDVREDVVTSLSEILANLNDLTLLTRHVHWNFRGPNFMSIHQMFDEFYAMMGGAIDEVAERLTALGGVASGRIDDIKKHSTLSPIGDVVEFDTLSAYHENLVSVANLVRDQISAIGDKGDEDTADLLTGISRDLDKRLWFLEATINRSSSSN